MSDSWSCLLVEQGPGLLDDVICAALKKAACVLSHKGLDAMRFKESVCEGRIETEWKAFALGSRSGIIFRTEVDADEATFRVNFLLSRADLERGGEVIRAHEEGAFMPLISGHKKFPIPELYDFSDLRSTPVFN